MMIEEILASDWSWMYQGFDLKVSIPIVGFTLLICFTLKEHSAMRERVIVDRNYEMFKQGVELFVNDVLFLNIRKGNINLSSAKDVGFMFKNFRWERHD